MSTVQELTAFDASTSPRRRGWVRIALGTLLLVGGIVVMALGVVEAIQHRHAYAPRESLTASGVLTVVGGIGIGLAGSWLAVWGLIGRRGGAARR